MVLGFLLVDKVKLQRNDQFVSPESVILTYSFGLELTINEGTGETGTEVVISLLKRSQLKHVYVQEFLGLGMRVRLSLPCTVVLVCLHSLIS